MEKRFSVPWHCNEGRQEFSSELFSSATEIESEYLFSDYTKKWLLTLDADSNKAFLEKRLDWDKLSLSRILSFAGEYKPESDRCSAGEWAELFKEIKEVIQTLIPVKLEDLSENDPRPFVDLFLPFAYWGEHTIRQIIREYSPSLRFSDQALRDIVDSLITQLVEVSEQILWHEFNKLRDIATVFKMHLECEAASTNECPKEFYLKFVSEILQSEFDALFESYPGLEVITSLVVRRWKDFAIEVILRLNNDKAAIAQWAGFANIECINNLEYGLSDPHRGRKSVIKILAAFLSCDGSRTAKPFLYKPKDMHLELQYNKIIDLICEDSLLAPLKNVRILLREAYGYAEFIDHKLPKDTNDLSSFYFNSGRLISILYLLGCTDCHFENLIAHTDQLVLVDTETLLEPLVSSNSGEGLSGLGDSVLKIGILPHWIFIGDDRLAIDISALGIEPPETQMVFRRGWIKLNSDLMLQGKVHENVDLPKCLPVGIGATNPIIIHIDQICKGFERQSQEIILHRKKWLHLLDEFRGKARRIVLRPTRIYGALAFEMFGPQNLRSRLDMSLVLEKLAITYLASSETRPASWPVFHAEVSAMLEADIPLFIHAVDGQSIQTSNGDDTGMPIFRSGFDLAKQRLLDLDTNEITLQSAIIRGAIQARLLRTSNIADEVLPAETQFTGKETGGRTEDKCIPLMIASRLLELSIRNKQGSVDWLGMNLHDDGDRFSFGSVGLNLYGGTIGIACFLQEVVSEYSNKYPHGTDKRQVIERCSVAVQDVLDPIASFLHLATESDLRRWWRDQPLGIAGSGGILLGLQLLHQHELVDRLLIGLTPERLHSDKQYDIISGSAGLAGALLATTKSSRTDELIWEAGNVLNKHVGECLATKEFVGLLGFAHGAGGLAAALAQIAKRTGDEAFIHSSKMLIRFERSGYDCQHKNWPDLRSGVKNFMTSWCSGAAGVALSRHIMFETDALDDHFLAEILVGLETTALASHLHRDHICCGSLGSAVIMEMLLDSYSTDSVRRLLTKAINVLHQEVGARVSEHGIDLRCFGSSKGSIVLPGLFTGLSGMGLASLRTAGALQMLSTILTAGYCR